ncbi:hypothetical protein K227x_22050 [Rubripirellula lacrimiformis]|uniref:Uncharacterized protein n=1 Tax=Rubripirellula lacrimiformis TaxID=1930273 RepID=A0A517N9L0_9BACT|nr:hypothetical protein K227x_22050 [Rubripirellula lacrimiformis]
MRWRPGETAGAITATRSAVSLVGCFAATRLLRPDFAVIQRIGKSLGQTKTLFAPFQMDSPFQEPTFVSRFGQLSKAFRSANRQDFRWSRDPPGAPQMPVASPSPFRVRPNRQTVDGMSLHEPLGASLGCVTQEPELSPKRLIFRFERQPVAESLYPKLPTLPNDCLQYLLTVVPVPQTTHRLTCLATCPSHGVPIAALVLSICRVDQQAIEACGPCDANRAKIELG